MEFVIALGAFKAVGLGVWILSDKEEERFDEYAGSHEAQQRRASEKVWIDPATGRHETGEQDQGMYDLVYDVPNQHYEL